MGNILSYLRRVFFNSPPPKYADWNLDDWCQGFRHHRECDLAKLVKALKEAEGIAIDESLNKEDIIKIFLNTDSIATLLIGTHLITKLGEVSSEVVQYFITLLHHSEEIMRRQAAIALYDVGTVEALAEVIGGNNHGRGIRTAACWKLSKFGEAAAPAIPHLFALLKYREINWRTHWAAAEALASIGEVAKPLLIENLNSSEIYLQHYSAIALSLLKPTPYLTPEVEKIIDENIL